MSIYKFLHEDIRKVKTDNFHIVPSLRNKFYNTGYINLLEIITTPTDRLIKDTGISKSKLKDINNQLRRVYLRLDISPEMLDWITGYYYNQYYHKLIPILHQKQKTKLRAQRSDHQVKLEINNFNS